MNRILKFILLSVMLIFLVACNKLKSGVVIDKYERSSYTSTIYVSNEKYGGYVIQARYMCATRNMEVMLYLSIILKVIM